MEKLKRIFKETLSYIAVRRLLRYSIIVIIILLPSVAILTNKYFNNRENTIEKVEEQSSNTKDNNNGVTKGSIDANAFIDKEVSKHTLSDGYSELPDDYSPSSSNNNESDVLHNTSSNISHNIDKSSISGIDLEILEGYQFNPKKDLKLQATDKDGSNISDNIIIKKNNVNTNIPGIYTVIASVRLSNGQNKEKEFTVTVKETKLDVSLESFKAIKENVKKDEKVGFNLDLKVSKNHITPTAVMINGQEYHLYKGDDNIIDKLTNKKNYKVFLDGNNISGVYKYNLEHVKMSNGAWISLGENIQIVEVLKDKASIINFNYEEESTDKRIEVKFDLNDLENTSSNLRVELYKENEILETIKLDKKTNYCMYLPIKSNGQYNLKILSDINLSQNENNIVLNKEIFNTYINISNIDQTCITGNDIEITVGQSFDIIKDLNLKATDFDGEDITDKIQFESKDVNVNNVGKQSIVVSVINKRNQKYTKEFYITVNERIETVSEFSRMLFKSNTSNEIKSLSSISSSNVTLIGDDSKPLSHRVDINGVVSKNDGSSPDGKIQVELPTTMSFTVDKKGNFTAPSYMIDNKSSVGISISVSEFIDLNENSGITIKPIDEQLDNLNRTNLHLALVGNNKNYVDLGKPISEPKEILTVEPLKSNSIRLLGEAGKCESKTVDNSGASDEFILVFKIQKI